jgi:hypothetical protein
MVLGSRKFAEFLIYKKHQVQSTLKFVAKYVQ